MFRLPLQRKPFYGSIAFWLMFSMITFTVAMAAGGASAESGSAPRAPDGREIFWLRCTACHGVDGRGDPGRQLLKIDMPNFADCSFASREPDSDFAAVIHGGGPARGFDVRMPAHGKPTSQAEIDRINAQLGDASEPTTVVSGRLNDAEIARVISHLRTFCTDERWPRGELNFPRPLLTEKAFPGRRGGGHHLRQRQSARLDLQPAPGGEAHRRSRHGGVRDAGDCQGVGQGDGQCGGQ